MEHNNAFLQEFWPAILSLIILTGLFIYLNNKERFRHFFRTKATTTRHPERDSQQKR